MTAPNKEALRLWVEALRSGKFKQGKRRNYIESEDSYCCLGVACIVALEQGVIEVKPWEADGEDTHLFSVADVPRKVAEWYGIPGLPYVAHDINAWDANDSRNWTFAEIADSIEKYYDLGDKPEVTEKKEELVG